MKVIQSNLITDKSANYIICNMDDGSMWSCDIQGKNWKKQKPTDNELTKSFIEEVKPPKR